MARAGQRMSHLPFQRPDLCDVTAQQLQPMEARFTHEWPETWRDFARSLFVTLISLPEGQRLPAAQAADLAEQQMLGIAQDMGGSQPYISVGSAIMRSSVARKIVQMLGSGLDYREVAQAVGLSDRHVRRIEAEWRNAEFSRRQARLDL